MDLESLALIFVLIIFGSILLSILYIWILIRREKREKFDNVWPVGSYFFSLIPEMNMPYGKWIDKGRDQHGVYVWERVE